MRLLGLVPQPQVERGERGTRHESEESRVKDAQKMRKRRVNDAGNLRQRSSSEPSEQSLTPSHSGLTLFTHFPLEHLKEDEEQVLTSEQKTEKPKFSLSCCCCAQAETSEVDAAHRLWYSSARRCGLCSRPRRRTPTTSSGTAGWSTRGNTCLLLKANACGGQTKKQKKNMSDVHVRALLFKGPLTTGAFLAAVCAAARTRTRATFRTTLAAAHHLAWPAGGCAHRSQTSPLSPRCPTATSPSPSQPPAPCTYSTWPRRVHPSSLSLHRRLSSEGCSVHPHSQTGVGRLGTEGGRMP